MKFYIIRCYYKDDEGLTKSYDLQYLNQELYIKLSKNKSILYKNADIKYNKPYKYVVSCVNEGRISVINEKDYNSEIEKILQEIKTIEDDRLFSKENTHADYKDDDFGIYVGKSIEENKIIEGYLFRTKNGQFTITPKNSNTEYPVYSNSIYLKKEIIQEISKPYPFISLENFIRISSYGVTSNTSYSLVITKDNHDYIIAEGVMLSYVTKMLTEKNYLIEGNDGNKYMLFNFKVIGIKEYGPGSAHWEALFGEMSKKNQKEEAKTNHFLLYLEELNEKEKMLLSMYPELLDSRREEIFESFWNNNKYESKKNDYSSILDSLSLFNTESNKKEKQTLTKRKNNKNSNTSELYSLYFDENLDKIICK